MSLKRGIKSLSIFLFIIVIITAGAILRLTTGHTVFSADLAYISTVPEGLALNLEPAETAVRDFYISLDKGDYDSVWNSVIEFKWNKEGNDGRISHRDEISPETGNFAGFTEKEDFIKRCIWEIGKGGYNLRLNNISAELCDPGDGKKHAYLLSRLPDSYDDVYTITAQGHMLGACTIFSWRKELLVIRTGDVYKIVLEGRKKADSFFYSSWFADIKKIMDLRKGRIL